MARRRRAEEDTPPETDERERLQRAWFERAIRDFDARARERSRPADWLVDPDTPGDDAGGDEIGTS